MLVIIIPWVLVVLSAFLLWLYLRKRPIKLGRKILYFNILFFFYIYCPLGILYLIDENTINVNRDLDLSLITFLAWYNYFPPIFFIGSITFLVIRFVKREVEKVNKLEIRVLTVEDQPEIDILMADIQKEFSEPYYDPHSKVTAQLASSSKVFWVATVNKKVVGTIGVYNKEGYGILKSFFVHKSYRGIELGVSGQLLKTAINWAVANNISQLVLGTMEQFKAAQLFYSKHGFTEITKEELPATFEINPLDIKFYKLKII